MLISSCGLRRNLYKFCQEIFHMIDIIKYWNASRGAEDLYPPPGQYTTRTRRRATHFTTCQCFATSPNRPPHILEEDVWPHHALFRKPRKNSHLFFCEPRKTHFFLRRATERPKQVSCVYNSSHERNTPIYHCGR